jgi:YHS domain-containing protein
MPAGQSTSIKITKMKRFNLLLIAVLFASVAAFSQRAEIFSDSGKAIKGYDAVAFFTGNKPVKGVDSLSYQYKGATWFFTSRNNLQLFMANPTAYMPQYGGYCAYGTADGHKAPTEIDTYTIVNNKLYFNYNKDVKAAWMKNQTALIRKADANWPALKDKD